VNAFAPDWGTPKALDEAGIAAIVQAFARSVQLALQADFDFIEIHAAHGYLIHQFLSPISNKRDDGYGATGRGRLRLLTEIVKTVRALWPTDRPLFCRLPAHDGHSVGLSEMEVLHIAKTLGQLGVDVIDVAASNVSPECRIVTAADMQRVSAAIRNEVGLVTTTAGAADLEQAKELLGSGKVDLIAVGRPLLTNPYWLLGHADDEQRSQLWPKQYVLATPKTA
jgi:2,4-dienoyl-CoA reductase-like NADH-dependent reductase (Old Yellow Enzyme family)